MTPRPRRDGSSLARHASVGAATARLNFYQGAPQHVRSKYLCRQHTAHGPAGLKTWDQRFVSNRLWWRMRRDSFTQHLHTEELNVEMPT